jgi:hypothetical protein
MYLTLLCKFNFWYNKFKYYINIKIFLDLSKL